MIIFALGFGSVFLSGLGFDVLSELGCFMRNWGGERVFIEYFSIFFWGICRSFCVFIKVFWMGNLRFFVFYAFQKILKMFFNK